MVFKVTFKNTSTVSGSVFIFQMHAGQKTGDTTTSIIWQAAPVRRGISHVFRWDDAMDFAWCERIHKPGEREIVTYGTIPMRDTSGNCALLTRSNNAYQLRPAAETAPEGHAVISTDTTVPSGNAFMGLGMIGLPTIVKPCGPDICISLPMDVSYWICIGDNGTIVPGHSVPQSALPDWNRSRIAVSKPGELKFPHAIQKLYAYFREDNTWYITPDYSECFHGD